MDIQDLPRFVRHSLILTDEEKRKLASLHAIPTEMEVDSIRHQPELQEMTNAFIGDESSRDTHLQLKAQYYLTKDEIEMAWKVLLL